MAALLEAHPRSKWRLDMLRLTDPWETPRWRLTLSNWFALAVGAGLSVHALAGCEKMPYFPIWDAPRPAWPTPAAASPSARDGFIFEVVEQHRDRQRRIDVVADHLA
jgi:hypothetical protein